MDRNGNYIDAFCCENCFNTVYITKRRRCNKNHTTENWYCFKCYKETTHIRKDELNRQMKKQIRDLENKVLAKVCNETISDNAIEDINDMLKKLQKYKYKMKGIINVRQI